MPLSRSFSTIVLLLIALLLGGCDARDCWLGIAHSDCNPEGSALAQFPQDDAICREYGLTPGTKDYVTCRLKKRAVRAETERATDYGFLQNPLTPDVTVTPAPAPTQ
jgi:hypothetical protein